MNYKPYINPTACVTIIGFKRVSENSYPGHTKNSIYFFLFFCHSYPHNFQPKGYEEEFILTVTKSAKNII